MTYYSIPEKVSAVVWFPEDGPAPVPDTATIKDIEYMQEMNSTVCANSQDITDTVELEDVRDGNKYKVKVLADGKCWMINNLQLDLSVIGIAAADASDHLSENYPSEGLIDRFNTSTTNAWVNTNTLDEFSKTPAKIASGSLQPDSGYFYSWCAATAKTCSSATTANVDAPGSICPKGWRLPSGKTGTNVNDFAILAGLSATNIASTTSYWSNISSKSFANNALTFNGSTWLAAGMLNATGLSNGGTVGYYWSRTSASNTVAYGLSFNGTNTFSAAYGGSRYAGMTIRCIADETVTTSAQISDRFAHTETQTVTSAVTVSVANTISIDAVSGTGNINIDSTEVGIGTISATVFSNTTYRVLLSAVEPNLQPQSSANSEVIPASNDVVAGTSAWGIQNSDGASYTAITTKAEEYSHTHPDGTSDESGSKAHVFTVGISASPTLPADTYSTDVTITAVSF